MNYIIIPDPWLTPWLRGPADGAKVNLLGEAVLQPPFGRWVCPSEMAISMEEMNEKPWDFGGTCPVFQTKPKSCCWWYDVVWSFQQKSNDIISHYLLHYIPNISELPSRTQTWAAKSSVSMISPALQLHRKTSRTGTFVNEVASRLHLRRHLQVAKFTFLATENQNWFREPWRWCLFLKRIMGFHGIFTRSFSLAPRFCCCLAHSVTNIVADCWEAPGVADPSRAQDVRECQSQGFTHNPWWGWMMIYSLVREYVVFVFLLYLLLLSIYPI